MKVREALERSLNVPAARLAQRVGIARVAQTARRLGLTSHLPEVPSLALGTAEVAPLEVAVAYSTLANGGRKPTPRTFVDLVETDGVVGEVRPLEGAERVLDPGVAYLAVSLLEGSWTEARPLGFGERVCRGPSRGKQARPMMSTTYGLWALRLSWWALSGLVLMIPPLWAYRAVRGRFPSGPIS